MRPAGGTAAGQTGCVVIRFFSLCVFLCAVSCVYVIVLHATGPTYFDPAISIALRCT